MSEYGRTNNAIVPVARILNLLAVAARLPENRDAKLHDAVLAVLDEIGADALIFRIGRDSQAVGVFRPMLKWERARKDLCIELIAGLAKLRRRKGCISEPFRDCESGEEYLFSFPPAKQQTGHDDDPDFFCFISGLKRRMGGDAGHAPRWTNNVKWSASDGCNISHGSINEQYREAVDAYCAAIEMAMMRRADADSILAPVISGRFWNETDDLSPVEHRVRPWEHIRNKPSHAIATASLSFDLRSSTFVMEHAIDKQKHAKWLENLTKVLRTLTRDHDGVFDKFTGDGVLAHFPIYDFEVENDEACRIAVRNCVACAWDMVVAAQYCGEYMRPNITLETLTFGAAAGIAFDMAAWSHDDAGNPIVVGRGVVHACRLSSGHEDKGVVLLTNAAFQRLVFLLGHQPHVCKVPFVTKEYSNDHKVTKVRMTKPPVGINFNAGNIRSIVQKIFEER